MAYQFIARPGNQGTVYLFKISSTHNTYTFYSPLIQN